MGRRFSNNFFLSFVDWKPLFFELLYLEQLNKVFLILTQFVRVLLFKLNYTIDIFIAYNDFNNEISKTLNRFG